jgi:hydrogenase expression/formation protein HypE
MRADSDTVRMAHGGGGLAMRELVRDLFATAFAPLADAHLVLEDAAVLPCPRTSRLAFTTDAFVVEPAFFPGGNIGDLAVNGTVNDLAMMGAKPLFLSSAFVIEEGFAMEDLRRIVGSMAEAARRAEVRVVAGDTKVVPRGRGDGVYIATSGVGEVPEGVSLSASALEPGDRIVVSGPVGDHGVAVMSRRAGLSFEAEVESDTASLAGLVSTMLEAGGRIRAMRDPTRGGLAAALHELAEDSGVSIEVEEAAIPVRPAVRRACDLLGFDPLHVPCEGRLVASLAEDGADEVLAAMRAHPLGRDAATIGRVGGRGKGRVTMRTTVGGTRLVDLPAGELLPRIC